MESKESSGKEVEVQKKSMPKMEVVGFALSESHGLVHSIPEYSNLHGNYH
jgi:hypothetical protein